MILGDVIIAAPSWLPLAIALAGVALLVLAWSYWPGRVHGWVRAVCGLLKAAAIVLLALCLLEPLYTGTRPTPGSNLFLVVADNSRSLQILGEDGQSRGAKLQANLANDSEWLARLSQDFDVRRYAFDSSLRPVKDFAELSLDGESSTLAGSLQSLQRRFRGEPVAGILILTDGSATDAASEQTDWSGLPPVYPIALGSASDQFDVSVASVAVSQTNFEAAPVTISAEIESHGLTDQKILVRVIDEQGGEVERRTVLPNPEGGPLAQRFLVRPERPGVSFYTVDARLASEDSDRREATLANNRRFATVDRGGGPYRILYIAGKPNWDFKFLRRALDEDDEVELVGVVRIARKEPKFTFRSRSGERTNPIFRGFGADDEQAEQYDEPVLLRLGTEDQDELRSGFPADAESLYRYQAVILDDIEAGFFTQDQQSLLQQFVSQRGGGLLMLGGKDSYASGGYNRTPIGEMLPVYLDRSAPQVSPAGYRLALTREGWLQPWIRVRDNQPDEEKRLAAMPAFHALNEAQSIKPGASVLAEVEVGDSARPALAAQAFGRGRVGALLVGDLWRWGMRREVPEDSDLEKSWRQTVRWLVADVPQPVEVEVRPMASTGGGNVSQSAGAVEVIVRARDSQFQPLDNATVTLAIETPDDRQIEITADGSDQAVGEYRATFTSRAVGPHRVRASVVGPDGSIVGDREAGWAAEPETEEFRQLAGNRPLLERIAAQSGGEMVAIDDLDRFVASLPNRKMPVVESWTYPIWHQWSMLIAVIGCLAGEWGLRRWKGLP